MPLKIRQTIFRSVVLERPDGQRQVTAWYPPENLNYLTDLVHSLQGVAACRVLYALKATPHPPSPPPEGFRR